ncbi:MAG TPA: hypothetical protein VK790_10275 [Solirubrobacteraceae bacterium]|nr:hypothetical protein [Solirubrobacteraceae bacterium]
MSRRIRIPSERQLKVIDDNGLHKALVSDHHDEVRRALEGVAHGVPGGVLHLDLAVSTLAELLRTQHGIRALVTDVVALGAAPMSEKELFAALSCWIIDNQIGRGFDWDTTVEVRRLERER